MPRDPALIEECRALVRALEPHPTLESLRADPAWPGLRARLARVLGAHRVHAPATPPPPARDPGRVHAVHWNLEHGNAYPRIEEALRTHAALRGPDLILLNEVDLGMARSQNRDVAGDLAAALGLHAVHARLFLETLPQRDTGDGYTGGRPNQEGLFGIALLSRWQLSEVRVVELPSPERLQFELERMFGRHVGLIATVERPGAPFVAVAAHLEVHRTRADRTAQMRALLDALRGESRPVLLAGDLNTHTFDRGLWHAPLAAAIAFLTTPDAPLARRFLHPDQGPWHEPLFDELRGAGFEWARFGDHEPTLRLRLERLDEMRVLFGPARGPAGRLFAPAERRARLRLDWFAGRGWQGGRGHTVHGLDGPGRASDHAPIVAEFRG